MGLISAELRNAADAGVTLVPVVELDIGGTTQRYGPTYVASGSGLYDSRVVDFGSLTRAVSNKGMRIQAVTFNVTIADPDSALHKIIEGTGARAIIGSAARLKVVAEGIDSSKFFTAFAGEIGNYAMESPRRWVFTLRSKDKPLKGLLNLPIVRSFDFTTAAESAIGVGVPAVYGVHASSGVTSGMIPTLEVDPGVRYLFSVGHVSAVPQLFKNDVLTGSGWTFKKIIVNGRAYSVVDFSPPITAGDKVDVDVNGLTDAGDGSGTLMENPADILKHSLVNFLYNEWQSGSWFADSTAPVNVGAFNKVAAYFDVNNVKSSRVVPYGYTGEQLLNEWCEEHQTPCFWSNQGQISIAPDDPTTSDIYIDWPWFRVGEHDRGELVYAYNTEMLANEVSADFLFSTADNKFFRRTRVNDTLQNHNVAESLSLHWARASL